jgi:hypothetical protein
MKKHFVRGLLLLALAAVLGGCARGPENRVVTPPTGRELRDTGIPDTSNRANKRGTIPGREIGR